MGGGFRRLRYTAYRWIHKFYGSQRKNDTSNRGGGYEDLIGYTLKTAIQKLNLVKGPNDSVEKEFIEYLNAIEKDYNRKNKQEIFPQKELDELYRETFRNSINIALMGFNAPLPFKIVPKYRKIIPSKNREADIYDLGLLQGKIYALCDFEHEIPKGIINIPKEVFDNCGFNLKSLMQDPVQVWNSEAFVRWVQREMETSSQMITQLESLENLDFPCRRIVSSILGRIKGKIQDIEKDLATYS
ncbi:hypothetical protein CSB09_03790 [Candidatus Gracilibacteria bacterium]|nr:MAG: hypothetical protein CSB09_03790 [Candidatus Gracilibacteria bacterium]